MLNLLLLPIWGLLGAVVATALATFTAVICQLEVNRRLGMQVSWKTSLLMCIPFLLGFGVEIATAGALGLLLIIATRKAVFNDEEREAIKAELLSRAPWLGRLLGGPAPAA